VIGMIESLAEATSSLTRVFSGWLSDRVGKRRPLVLLGYSLSNLVKPALALAPSWPSVLALRVTDRLGKGIRTAPRDALIAIRVLPRTEAPLSACTARWTQSAPRSGRSSRGSC